MDERRPLWAPWRMEYIESGATGACIFCEPAQSRGDRERLILHRGRYVCVRLNRYPYAPGHLLVAPYAHRARIGDLDGDQRAELMTRIAESAELLEKTYRCDGLNVGANLGRAAGAGYADHLHFHLVPRWSADTNFMTVVGEVRVIPQHIEQIYSELAERFAEIPA